MFQNGGSVLRDGAYWSEPDPSGFKIRGPSYLMDKVKVPCGEALFKLLDCDLFDVDAPQPHMARHLGARMSALWAESVPPGPLEPHRRAQGALS